MKTKIIIPRRENAAKMRKVRVFCITMLMCVFADTARHGSFDGSVVRVKGDPVLKRRASEVTAEDLACQNDDGKTFGERNNNNTAAQTGSVSPCCSTEHSFLFTTKLPWLQKRSL